jgi:hypothetical protein
MSLRDGSCKFIKSLEVLVAREPLAEDRLQKVNLQAGDQVRNLLDDAGVQPWEPITDESLASGRRMLA